MSRWTLRAMHAGYAASLAPAWARFSVAASRPDQAQRARLRAILQANAGTAFGKEHAFDRIDTLEAYRDRVPIRRFDQFQPWVDRVAEGEPAVLTAEPVRMMERTSGSTSPNKLVPFTNGFLSEIAAATHPWLFDLFRRCPGLSGQRSYWAISPATRGRDATPGGIPIGIDDDTEYFGPIGRWVLGSMMAVPSHVGRIADVGHWRWETCRHLVQCEDLGLISVWSPTFATRMMESIEANLSDLLVAVGCGRADRIRRAMDRQQGKLTAEALWPKLAVVSCWTAGPSRTFLPALRRWFPHATIQPKGLLATEGVVSFPLWGREGSVLSVAGHFLEFIDAASPTRAPKLAHELREGDHVSPVLTTSGGLYRYHLQDQVRCVGRYRAVPCIRFEGRLDCVSDLAGEKLDAQVVGRAIGEAAKRNAAGWRFAMLAPELDTPPGYQLYLEGDGPDEAAEAMARDVETALLQGAHYAYCRKLGQIREVRAVLVGGGIRALERRRAEEGGRLGELKPSPLDRRSGWQPYFLTVRRPESAGNAQPLS